MVNVRAATESDVDIVYELLIAIARHHDEEQFVLTDKEELLRAGFGESPSYGVLLAEIDGQVAGYCSYTWNYSIWLGGKIMNIDDVFVWEQYRGKQIGESLMQMAKTVCTEHRVTRIRWQVERDNHGAIKFYERLGASLNIKGIFRWDISE